MDLDGNRVYVVLVKDGEIVASQVITPANEGMILSSTPVREPHKK